MVYKIQNTEHHMEIQVDEGYPCVYHREWPRRIDER